MMKQRVFFCFFFLFFFLFGFSQTREIDSLKNELLSAKQDTLNVNTLIALSTSLMGTSPDEAIIYANKAKTLATRLNYLPGLAVAFKKAGIGYFYKGLYAEALNQYKSSLVVFEMLKDKNGIANINNNMGNIYYNKGEFFKALNLYIISLKISEQLGDKTRIATAYGNIGAVYSKKPATYYKALEYYKKAFKLGEELHDKNITSTSSGNIGEIYLDQGNTENALNYLMKALKVSEGTEGYPFSLISVGKVYYKKRDFSSAVYYFEQAYQYATKIDAKLDMANALIELGKSYEKKAEYKVALEKFKEAEVLSRKLDASEQLKFSYTGLANLYGSLSQFNNAYKYQKLLTSINDTIYNVEGAKKLNNLQFSYDLEKKQSEINLLQKQKELSTKEIKSKQTIQFALLAFLAAVSVLLVFVYRFYIIKKKSNIELEDKNQKIESQKSEITKSIEYAKKIQDAMLPEEDLIVEVLYNSFLLYKPKDIVSGDFYVCINENKKIFLAVADCTGHGVPGALMSMIGSNILNKLITDKGLTEPTDILEQLNTELIASLKQNKNEGNDGMDIALCVIDFNAGNLKFAGAYRPLWMIRDNELNEIKGSKFPIGGHQIHDERLFKTHTVHINKSDRFYIFTDGFADQFGGDYGKKMTTRKLKEYLVSTKSENIKKQGTSLTNYFEKWKGSNEQLDDVCFIGFEVL